VWNEAFRVVVYLTVGASGTGGRALNLIYSWAFVIGSAGFGGGLFN